MVSADGGKSWAEAALQGLVHPKAFTRFRMPVALGRASPLVLQSRRLGRGRQTCSRCVPSSSLRAGQTEKPVDEPARVSRTSTTTVSPAGASTTQGASSMSTRKLFPALAAALAFGVGIALAESPRARPADHRGPTSTAWETSRALPDGKGPAIGAAATVKQGAVGLFAEVRASATARMV